MITDQIKKLLAYAMVLIVTLLTATACNSSEDGILGNPTQISVVNTPEIILDLQNFNNSLEPLTYSRGEVGWLGWLTVAMRDGTGAFKGVRRGAAVGGLFGPQGATVGAVIGGVINSAADSYTQWYILDQMYNISTYSLESFVPTKATYTAAYTYSKKMVPTTDVLQSISVISDTCALKIAFLHNAILGRVKSYENSTDEDFSLELSEVEKYVLTSSEFNTLYLETTSRSSFETTIKVEGKNVSDQIVNLFFEAVSSSCTDQNSLNRIIAYYASTVHSSNDLDEIEKLSLLAAFAVTGCSFGYWSEKWPYDGM